MKRCASGQPIKPAEAGYRRLHGGRGESKGKTSRGQKGKGCRQVHAQRVLARIIYRHTVRTHDITRNDFPVELAPQHPIFVYHFDPCRHVPEMRPSTPKAFSVANVGSFRSPPIHTNREHANILDGIEFLSSAWAPDTSITSRSLHSSALVTHWLIDCGTVSRLLPIYGSLYFLLLHAFTPCPSTASF